MLRFPTHVPLVFPSGHVLYNQKQRKEHVVSQVYLNKAVTEWLLRLKKTAYHTGLQAAVRWATAQMAMGLNHVSFNTLHSLPDWAEETTTRTTQTEVVAGTKMLNKATQAIYFDLLPTTETQGTHPGEALEPMADNTGPEGQMETPLPAAASHVTTQVEVHSLHLEIEEDSEDSHSLPQDTLSMGTRPSLSPVILLEPLPRHALIVDSTTCTLAPNMWSGGSTRMQSTESLATRIATAGNTRATVGQCTAVTDPHTGASMYSTQGDQAGPSSPQNSETPSSTVTPVDWATVWQQMHMQHGKVSTVDAATPAGTRSKVKSKRAHTPMYKVKDGPVDRLVTKAEFQTRFPDRKEPDTVWTQATKAVRDKIRYRVSKHYRECLMLAGKRAKARHTGVELPHRPRRCPPWLPSFKSRTISWTMWSCRRTSTFPSLYLIRIPLPPVMSFSGTWSTTNHHIQRSQWISCTGTHPAALSSVAPVNVGWIKHRAPLPLNPDRVRWRHHLLPKGWHRSPGHQSRRKRSLSPNMCRPRCPVTAWSMWLQMIPKRTKQRTMQMGMMTQEPTLTASPGDAFEEDPDWEPSRDWWGSLHAWTSVVKHN